MTTPGRPTFESARGGAHQGARLYVPSQKYSKLDLPGHLVLKERHVDPDAPAEPTCTRSLRASSPRTTQSRAHCPRRTTCSEGREDDDKEEESRRGDSGRHEASCTLPRCR